MAKSDTILNMSNFNINKNIVACQAYPALVKIAPVFMPFLIR